MPRQTLYEQYLDQRNWDVKAWLDQVEITHRAEVEEAFCAGRNTYSAPWDDAWEAYSHGRHTKD